MNHLKDPRILIVALKGLPTSIAVILGHYAQPVTQKHLCDMFGSSDKTVSSALHQLEEFKIIVHSAEGWSVTENVNLLWPTNQEAQVTPEPVDKPVDICPVGAFPQEKGRKFSDPCAPSSTSSSYLTSLKLEKNLLLELEPEVEPEPEPELEPELEPEPKSPEKYQECYKTALAAGIWEPKARELARMPHVTPELIEYHIGKAVAEKKEIPLAIFRIVKNREIRKPPDRKSQDWHERQRYVTGPYAEFINH